jgi:hypothetical protein
MNLMLHKMLRMEMECGGSFDANHDAAESIARGALNTVGIEKISEACHLASLFASDAAFLSAVSALIADMVSTQESRVFANKSPCDGELAKRQAARGPFGRE